jgi:hypothetical protein
MAGAYVEKCHLGLVLFPRSMQRGCNAGPDCIVSSRNQAARNGMKN